MRLALLGLVLSLVGCGRPRAVPGSEVSAPGVSIFIERAASEHDSPPSWGMARVDGRTLRGKAAFDAVRSKVGDDPTKLAALSILFLEDDMADAQLWTHAVGGAYPPEQDAAASLPRLTGDTLEYWRFERQLAGISRCRASLGTGKVTCESGGEVVHAAQLAADPAGTVKQELGSDNVEMHVQGITDLGALGGDDARAQLIDLALNSPNVRDRMAAMTALGKLGGAGVVDALTRSLLHDGHADARAAAAEALGNLRDPSARPALEQARDHDADAGVVRVAMEALKKL